MEITPNGTWRRSVEAFLMFAALFVVPVMAEGVPSKVINTEWLAANLSREDLSIIDVRDSLKDYWQDHSPEPSTSAQRP